MQQPHSALEVPSTSVVDTADGQQASDDPTDQMPVGQRHLLVARGRDDSDVTALKGISSGRGAHALGVQWR